MTDGSDSVGVSICVLSWNGLEHLEHCLPALAEQLEPGTSWEVLVLDNGSTDGTVDWMQRTWEGRRLGSRGQGQLRFLASRTNSGFCAGNNQLARAARGDWLVLLNNDTRPEETWLQALWNAAASAPDDVAAIGGRIVDWEGERIDFVQGLLTFDGHAFQRHYGKPIGEVEEPTTGGEQLFACGGNMIVRKHSFLDGGGFDPAYFAYLEDVDLGWRLWSGGERVLYTAEATVHHRSMATSNALGAFNRGLLFERNALRTAYKNFDDDHWRRLAPAILTTFFHRTMTLMVRNNPGGETLALDPYAASESSSNRTTESPPTSPPDPSWREKWRAWGTLGLARRGLRRFFDGMADRLRRPGDPGSSFEEATSSDAVRLSDPQTVAHLRAFHHFVAELESAADERHRLLDRRRRSDEEIFDRFGLYLVPTYPGDEELFLSDGFQALLPDDLPLRRQNLDDLMDL